MPELLKDLELFNIAQIAERVYARASIECIGARRTGRAEELRECRRIGALRARRR